MLIGRVEESLLSIKFDSFVLDFNSKVFPECRFAAVECRLPSIHCFWVEHENREPSRICLVRLLRQKPIGQKSMTASFRECPFPVPCSCSSESHCFLRSFHRCQGYHKLCNFRLNRQIGCAQTREQFLLRWSQRLEEGVARFLHFPFGFSALMHPVQFSDNALGRDRPRVVAEVRIVVVGIASSTFSLVPVRRRVHLLLDPSYDLIELRALRGVGEWDLGQAPLVRRPQHREEGFPSFAQGLPRVRRLLIVLFVWVCPDPFDECNGEVSSLHVRGSFRHQENLRNYHEVIWHFLEDVISLCLQLRKLFGKRKTTVLALTTVSAPTVHVATLPLLSSVRQPKFLRHVTRIHDSSQLGSYRTPSYKWELFHMVPLNMGTHSQDSFHMVPLHNSTCSTFILHRFNIKKIQRTSKEQEEQLSFDRGALIRSMCFIITCSHN